MCRYLSHFVALFVPTYATSACLVDSRTSKGLQTARRAKRGITQQTTPPLHVTNALSVDTRVQAAKQIVRVAQKAVTTHQTLNRTVYLAPVILFMSCMHVILSTYTFKITKH